jgi:hypothetical protein
LRLKPTSLASEVMTMKHEGHIYFIVFGKEFRGRNSMIPSYVDADISVSPIPDVSGGTPG